VRQVAPRSLRQRAPHRGVLVILIAVAALLAAPGATGIPGDPTPPEVTPLIFGTLGANGWRISNVTVNWNEQAALSAASYLDSQSFSRSGLMEQLVFEGFTRAQAAYGVSVAY